MRVLHCLHNYHPARGGAEWLMKNVSERLAAKGHDVTVIASNALSVEDYVLPGGGKRLLPIGQDDVNGVRVRRVPFSRRARRHRLEDPSKLGPFHHRGRPVRFSAPGRGVTSRRTAAAAPPAGGGEE
jgi:glycosyltransferase involved in cell wall biosynthesis